MKKLSDLELLRECAAARKRAHEAKYSNCFDRSREFFEFAAEVERRGLSQPEAA